MKTFAIGAMLGLIAGCGLSEVWVDSFYVTDRPALSGPIQIHQGALERYAFGTTRTEIEGESRFAADSIEADPTRLEIADTGELYCPPNYQDQCLHVWSLRGLVRGDVPVRVTAHVGWPTQSVESSTIVHVLPATQ